MKIIHYDLFAGIGGFSYAIDQVYGKENVHHIFSEIDPFCQAVLKKHWPEGEYWGDIREFIAYTDRLRLECPRKKRGISEESKEMGGEGNKVAQTTKDNDISRIERTIILTGGFPCQPFSVAGKRRGAQDNRYLWPEMFRVIQLVKPQWVIAENVYGLLTIEGGLVFEQVCSDLETEGYEVQTLIIPAVAVNAPHRRDRVWIIAHTEPTGTRSESGTVANEGGRTGKDRQEGIRQAHRQIGASRTESTDSNAPNPRCKRQTKQQKQTERSEQCDFNAPNSTSKRLCGGCENESGQQSGVFRENIQPNASNPKSGQSRKQTEQEGWESFRRRDWERDWKEVAFATCNDRVDDGFRNWMAGLPRDIDDIMMGYAIPQNTGTTQILSCLREAIQSPKIREQIRGLYSVEEEEVLFEVLCKFKEVCEHRRLFDKSKKTQKESLQSLWLKQFIKQIEHSPQRREYYEQQARKLTNIMSRLSYETALAITKIGHCFWLLYTHLYPQKMGREINGQRLVRLPDGTKISYAKWRQEGLKAFGNGIVPQVAIEILKAIRSLEPN